MKKKWFIPIFASFIIFSGFGATNTEAASVSDVTTTAKQYLKAPYLYGGTSIEYGIDCSAYTRFVFSKLGINLPRTSAAQYQLGSKVAKSDLQEGDLVFFNTTGRGVSHVGIYIGNGQFISATTSSGVKIDSINDPYYWGSKYIGAKRVANFTSEVNEVKSAAIDFNVYASRGEVAMKLAEALGLDTTDTNSQFVDIKSTDQYVGAVNALHELGIFNGDANGKFNPNSPITRGEIAKVLVNAFNLSQIGSPENFTDVSSNHWAFESVSVLSSNNITAGTGDGSFGVNEHVTKKQLEIFLDKLK